MEEIKVGDIKKVEYKSNVGSFCYEVEMTGYVMEVTEENIKVLCTDGDVKYALKENILKASDVSMAEEDKAGLLDMVRRLEMKKELKKITVNVESKDYDTFTRKARSEGDLASRRLRVLVARDIVKNYIARDAVAVLGLMEKMEDKKMDTQKFRKAFESLDITEEEREEILQELDGVLAVKSREYSILKEMVDRSEFLDLPSRGAYKPVVLKTLAGLGIAYSKTVDSWLEEL